MRDLPANTTSALEEPPSKPPESPAPQSAPSNPASEWISASQDALFDEVTASGCDACGEEIPEGDGAEGYGIPGRGIYLSARGDETRLESVPLCVSCASAIGMTALARWEIEEEEG